MTTSQFVDNDTLAASYPRHIASIIERHDRALERAGAGHAVICSGAPHPVFLDDYNYPFKPSPHFLSWLPLTDMPHSYVVHTPGETPVLIYFQAEDYWHVTPSPPEGYWVPHFDIRIVHNVADIASELPAARDKCILIGEVGDDSQDFDIERINPATAMNLLHFERAIKTEYELECMRGASRRAVAGHRAAEAAFRQQQSEFAIHLDYCRAAGHGDNDLPYGNIVALNENAAVLHYQHQSRDTPSQHRSFLIDAGARVNGYASDITRTYSYADDEFAAMISRFDQLQLELVAMVKEGVSFPDIHLACHRLIAALLIEFDLASGSPESLIESDVTSAFYPHGLGHLLGLQVHDIGGHQQDDTGKVADPPSGHPFLRLTRSLECDQVLTIEPGLYVIDMLLDNLRGTPGHDLINWARVDWLRPYGGIRIEDNVRVLKTGCENFTRDAFGAG